MQPVAQRLEQLQGLGGLALLGRDPHEGAPRRFTERIEREQPARGGRRPVEGAGPQRLRDELRERLLGAVAQPLALHEQPFLECRIADADPVQELAPIEGCGLLERVSGAFGDQPLEFRRIGDHRCGVERDRMAVGQDRGGADIKALPQPAQRMFEAVARLPVAAIAPEQAGQLLAGQLRARGEGKHGQERAILLSGNLKGLILRAARLEASKESQPHGRHRDPPARDAPLGSARRN
jgi:hypothetical protein